MSSDVVVILRFMPQKRVDSFLSGELYLNTLEYFAELEGDPVRSDIHEGAQHAWQVTQIEMADDNGNFLNIPPPPWNLWVVFQAWHGDAGFGFLVFYMYNWFGQANCGQWAFCPA